MNDKPKKAVALKYDPVKNNAPHVVAKGSGEVADKIVEKAAEHDVLVREDKALIQLLYQLEINEQIPPHLYPIIAEVFTLVYQAEQLMEALKNE